MYTLAWKTIGIVFGLSVIVASMVYARNTGHMCCMSGANGMMQSSVDMSQESTAANALKITAKMASPAKTGDNALNIVLKNAANKPVTGAKITTQVAMTSMDMGTTSPPVSETGKGHYTTTVAFSMAGPWRVTVKVVTPGQKPQIKSFDFTAG